MGNREDVLPLSKPIMTTDGRTIQELAVPKGASVYSSMGYNRTEAPYPALARRRCAQERAAPLSACTGICQSTLIEAWSGIDCIFIMYRMTSASEVRTCIGKRLNVSFEWNLLLLFKLRVRSDHHFRTSTYLNLQTCC